MKTWLGLSVAWSPIPVVVRSGSRFYQFEHINATPTFSKKVDYPRPTELVEIMRGGAREVLVSLDPGS
jgi:hypothetical protein